MPSYDYLIYAMASGETSQAYAVIKQMQKRLLTSVLAIGKPIGEHFFGDHTSDIPYEYAPTTKELKILVEKYHPKKMLFFNSKSFRRESDFIINKPLFLKQIPCFTLDSNWLFENSQIYPSIRWADKNFVNFPPELFEMGLKKKGGYFAIDEHVLARIHPIGFIPSYQKISPEERTQIRAKLGVMAEQKLIFCYFSGFGAQARTWVFENLIKSLDILNNPQIKVVYAGDTSLLDSSLLSRPYLINAKGLDINNFYKTLSASDLIFQHQGLATMAQGIAAQIPIIANVSFYKDEELPYLHKGEIEPFEKLGLCRLFEKTTSIDLIIQAIKTLLFDKPTIDMMNNSQKRLSSIGEEVLINEVEMT